MTSLFVVMEGMDGAGTTTQTRRVAQALQGRGRAVDISCEPSEGVIGELIRKMLSEETGIEAEESGGEEGSRQMLALLFAADRLHHLAYRVEPALRAGKVAISDRYYHSSLAYQGDDVEEQKVDYEWVRQINKEARVPDLTIFLEASAQLCWDRLQERSTHDMYESQGRLQRLEKRYEEVMGMLAEEGQRIVRLDAGRPQEELTERIVAEILQS